MKRRIPRPAGFTLVELLVVLLIVSIIAAVTLPVVIPAIGHRQVSETARIIQGGLVAARDAALRTNTPHGIRFLPDPTYNGQTADPLTKGATSFLDRGKILASNRFIPIERPPTYSDGKVFLDPANTLIGSFINRLGINTGLFTPAEENWLYTDKRVLLVVQAYFRTQTVGATTFYPREEPTSWYWNIRVGDKIQINDIGPYFTVVGPVHAPNPENFVNVDPSALPLELPHPSGTGVYYPEILFVTNGVDDDGDGYVDNGMDGLDNDGNGTIDDFAEWSDPESWPSGMITGGTAVVGDKAAGVSYNIIRQPVPSAGSRETVLPDSVVVDLTTSLWPAVRERSRLPVDPDSGTVDILVEPSGRVVPTTKYSSPTSFGMGSSFYHIWVAERSDLAEPTVATRGAVDGRATALGPLLASPAQAFYLPMPRDAYDAYDVDLVNDNPTLPYLKGEMRLLTISTRTGNMITTDRPLFSVTNPGRPFYAPQVGEQGDAP